MIQGSTEWYEARRGKTTASRFAEVLAKPRGDKPFGDSAMSYLYTLVGERLSGFSHDETQNTPIACEYGKEQEPVARAAYQWSTGNNVAEFGFSLHAEHKDIGASADGVVVEEDGIIEIKCPWTCRESTRTLCTLEIPRKYKAQVQGILWVSDRQWCDYVSFDSRLPKHLQLCIIRVQRDEEYIKTLSERIVEFAQLVSKTERELRNVRRAKQSA